MEGERLTIKNPLIMSIKTPIANYLFNLKERSKATHRIKPDGSVEVLYKGSVLSPDAFNSLFPLMIISHKRDNIDSRSNWMRK